MKQKLIHWFIRKIAARNGFLDPFALLDRLRSFSRPSKVQEPIELIRAGAVFHARGLLNTKAIQHNLDWVWPYWTEKQFDPHSPSFLPRAFSATHVNLTQRNWTAVGLPDCVVMPVVDPRGLVTPLYDGWSVDTWFFPDEGDPFFPSRSEKVQQNMSVDEGRQSVSTSFQFSDAGMILDTWLSRRGGEAEICNTSSLIEKGAAGMLVISLRPCNPEGVSFIDELTVMEDQKTIRVNQNAEITFSTRPDRILLSDYQSGDVADQLLHAERGVKEGKGTVQCSSGMATAAVCFRVDTDAEKKISWSVDCSDDPADEDLPQGSKPSRGWTEALDECPAFTCPDQRIQRLYQQSLISLLILSPQEVYPGPYTYRRFWFRDAALMMQSLLFAGQFSKCREILDGFPGRQTSKGYFHSQEGEWDSNGQVLWIYDLYEKVSHSPLTAEDLKAVEKGAEWILKHRVRDKESPLHDSLLPPGFSAEHLGPIDYYWWDNFWALGGLYAAVHLLEERNPEKAKTIQSEAVRWHQQIDDILNQASVRRHRPAIAAGPYRRMDAGAIGSIVGGYPLRMHAEKDERVLDTIDYLKADCFYQGAFFQEMIHSGVNAYLSLHIAQVLMRGGDAGFLDIVEQVAELATSTGQWPEAIHPSSGGGCMGDGHHGWASAEWFMMIRNMMIREEGGCLILGNGLIAGQLKANDQWAFGPAPTEFGSVRVEFKVNENATGMNCTLDAEWVNLPENVVLMVQGLEKQEVEPDTKSIEVSLKKQD